MKLVGPDVPRRVRRPHRQHPPGAVARRSPGMHGPADALAYGVKVTGCTLFVVDAGVDTGPIVAQRAVPVEDDDTVETLHERIKVAERAMLVDAVGRMAREGFTITDRKVRFGNEPTQRQDRVPIRRALVSVYDKTGLEDLVRGLHDAGVALVSTGGSAALIESLGVPVTQVEELTGFPECLDGRVKTLHPRVHAGHPRRPRAWSPTATSSTSSASSRSTWWSSTSTRSPTPWRRAPRPTSASSRSTSAARRWCAPRPRTTRSSRSSPRPARYADVLAAVAAGGFTLAERRRLAAEAFAHTATYDVAVASWCATSSPTRRRHRLARRSPARPGSGGGAALRREPAPARRALRSTAAPRPASPRPSSCTARRCPTTTTSTPTRPAARRTTSTGRPWRSSSTPTRAASPSAPTSPRRTARRTRATRCRRSAASSPTNRPVSVAMAEQVAEVFTEVVVAPAFDDGAVEVLQAKKNIRLLGARRPRRGGGRDRGRSAAACCVQTVDRVDGARATTRPPWTLASGRAGRRARCWPTWRSPGARAAR